MRNIFVGFSGRLAFCNSTCLENSLLVGNLAVAHCGVLRTTLNPVALVVATHDKIVGRDCVLAIVVLAVVYSANNSAGVVVKVCVYACCVVILLLLLLEPAISIVAIFLVIIPVGIV